MSETINDSELRSVFLTRNSIVETASVLRDVIGRDIGKHEITGLIAHMKGQNYNTFRNVDTDIVRNIIANSFAKRIQMQKEGDYVIDTHELMKRNIGRLNIRDGPDDDIGTIYNHSHGHPDSIPNIHRQISTRTDHGDNNATTLPHRYESFDTESSNLLTNLNTNILNSVTGLRSEFKLLKTVQDVYSSYMLLDSRYRKLEGAIGNPINEYRWEYTPTIYTTQGTANVISRIQDILYIQVQEFHIPYSADADNIYKRVSMLIQEFSALAVIAHENRRYHLLFHTEIEGNRIRMGPPPTDEGKFRFATPINKVDQLTISFGSPLTPIQFKPDRYHITAIPVNQLMTHILFTVAHDVNNGEIVLLSGFTTAAATIDESQINVINRDNGHVVTVVNATTLSIAVDLTTITALATPPVVECFITTRRVLIPVRMVYAHKPAI